MNRLLSLITVLIAVVGLFLVGAYIEYSTGFPFAVALRPFAPAPAPVSLSRDTPVSSVPSRIIPQSSTTRTDVPIVSRAQGAQDAARADVPMGEAADLDRCYQTMIARKLIPTEAKTVCAKLIGGISH